jgi:N-acetyl sugar amidotransferase
MNICSRCILDDTIKDIWFDTNGICKYCYIHEEMEKEHSLKNGGNKKIENIISKIKEVGKNNDYDCIAGISGGRDSTYTLYKAVQLGLKPLAVHFDYGWNSDISVTNIKNVCEKLKVDLHTVVADWEEFKDLQIAFLKSGTPDADIPADYAIYSVLFDTAHKEGIKYILNGHSFRTEGTSPISWTYMDGRYIKNVHKQFGRLKIINSFPVMTMSKLLYYIFVNRIKEVRLMEYINYVKQDVDSFLEGELGWKYYGGHHHENNFTKFIQSFYLPKRFGIDKRKTELAAMIRSGQIKRDEALEKVHENPYHYEKENVEYVINKLGLTKKEFDDIFNAPIKSHDDYPTYLPYIRLFKYPIRIAVSLNLLPQIFYLKYAK